MSEASAVSTTPDPRPAVLVDDDRFVLRGWRCSECSYPMLWASPRCPECAGSLVETRFGPDGVVWSSTVVRVPVPGRTPPYSMAYVNLDDGPRVLAHVRGTTERLEVGSRIRLVEQGPDGDVTVEGIS